MTAKKIANKSNAVPDAPKAAIVVPKWERGVDEKADLAAVKMGLMPNDEFESRWGYHP